MNKAFSRVNWRNLPNRTTPINETNLNKSDLALDTIDDRVISLDVTKFDKSSANGLIKNFQLNQNTGVITITWYDNSTVTFDTLLEKIAVNFDYDDDPSSAHYQNLIITLSDGTVKYIDLSALITEYEFDDTSTIDFRVSSTGRVSAVIKTGSVTDDLIEANYLANITVQAQNAAASAEDALASENAAEYYKDLSMSYAIGSNGEVREGDATDNSKYYKEQAAISATNAATSETNAANSAISASDSADLATTKASNASASAQAAYQSELNAATSETNASTSESNALSYKNTAVLSAQAAASSELNAKSSEDLSKSYAVGTNGQARTGDATDNSKYYSEQAAASVVSAGNILDEVEEAGQDALDAIQNALDNDAPEFEIDFTTGHLMYGGTRFVFLLNSAYAPTLPGHLMWGLTV